VMKKLVKRVAAHARSHRDALENRLEQSTLSGGQARVIIERIPVRGLFAIEPQQRETFVLSPPLLLPQEVPDTLSVLVRSAYPEIAVEPG